jgi:mono/diheme cytochrome c family protein
MRSVTLAALSFALLGAAPTLAADGGALYQTNCAKCHGEDGNADTPVGKAMKAPPVHAGTLPPAKVVEYVRTNAKHKSISAKLSDEELDAIARALPAGS